MLNEHSEPRPMIRLTNIPHIVPLLRLGQGSIEQIAFSPDGRLLAVASSLGAYTYDIADGTEMRFLEIGMGVTCLAFSPDGAMLALGCTDHVLRLWRLADAAFVRTLQAHQKDITHVAFAPDSRLVAEATHTGQVRVWSVDSSAVRQQLPKDTCAVTCLRFLDDRVLLVARADGSIGQWRVTDQTVLHITEGPDLGMMRMAVAPNGALYALAGVGGIVQLRRLSDAGLVGALELPEEWVGSLAFTPDSQTLVVGTGHGVISSWDIPTLLPGGTFIGHTAEVTSLAFSLDGQVFASGSLDTTIRLWKSDSKMLLHIWSGFSNVVLRLACTVDSGIIAAGSRDGTIGLWSIAEGRELRRLVGQRDAITCLAFSPDGETLASGAFDGTIWLSQVVDGSTVRILTGHEAPVSDLAFALDGQVLVSGGRDDSLRFWRTSTGELLQVRSYEEHVESLAVAPFNEIVAVGTHDGTVRLWHLDYGKQSPAVEIAPGNVNSLAFAPQGGVLAAGLANGSLQLWQIDRNQETSSLHAILRWSTLVDPTGIAAVTFNADGQIMALASGNVIQFRRVGDGALITTLEGHNTLVNTVIFTPDGRFLVSGSSDGAVRLWGVG